MTTTGRRAATLIVAAIFIAVIALPALLDLTADWLWFQEIGHETVFTREVLTKLGIFVVVGSIAFGLLYLNLRLAQRGVVPDPVLIRFDPTAPHVDVTQTLRRVALPVALVLSLLFALGATASWMTLLQFVHGTSFGQADPVFGRDIGFYVFTLPALATGLGLLRGLLVLSLLLVIPLYWVRGDLILPPKRARVEPSAALHLALLLALVFVVAALQTWLVRLPELLYSSTGPLIGASYTDMNARRPALMVTAVAAVLAAVLVLLGAARRKLVWYAVLAIAGYLGVSILANGVFPAAMQRLVVAPNELTKELPYLRHHITATRQAWGLEDVETRDLTADAVLSMADVRANSETIDNVRLWDRDPLLQTFGQLQEIRTYYDFVSVDDDRYRIDGRYRQVLLSPRELNSASLPTRTFINEHLTFTHGMGITLGPVNQVTEEGLPVLFIKDLPPVSTVSLRVTRPQIYYGELTSNYVIVRTRLREFDYPAGEANIFTSYGGTGGVAVSSFARRALLAARFRSLKILLTQDITDQSKVLYHRTISERARRALPFLRFDADPYLVVNDAGELHWILDGYTTSGRYPYAQRLADGTSYMRNSAKVVIDAYNGTVDAFVADTADPIIRTHARIFAGIMRPLSEMPPDLLAHVRYPEDLYRVQTALYTIYHMDDPELFYHREDQWQIPVVAQRERQDPFMRRIIMRLPDEERAEFIFMTPFTPRQKDNLAAWMVARSDGEHYGKLRVYRFPKQSLVYGPRQIVNRINQDTDIARQITLWDQRGSEVIRGELLVIPIEESLLYVQPLYLRAEGGRIPELKRVVVAYQNRVVMEETLDEALEGLFAGGMRPPAQTLADAGDDQPETVAARAGEETAERPLPARTTGADARFGELARRAQEHYEQAVAAQRSGDWARYGAELERLGTVLRQMRQGAGPQQ